LCIKFDKNGLNWAKFWAIFSQTHLLTQIANNEHTGQGDKMGRIFAYWAIV
jgi:hypothetical protein